MANEGVEMGYTIAFVLGVATGLLGPATVNYYRRLRHAQYKQAYPQPEPPPVQIYTPEPATTPGPPVLNRWTMRNVPARRAVRRNGRGSR